MSKSLTVQELKKEIQSNYSKLYRLKHKDDPEFIRKEKERLDKYYQREHERIKKRSRDYYHKNQARIIKRVQANRDKKRLMKKLKWIPVKLKDKLYDIES